MEKEDFMEKENFHLFFKQRMVDLYNRLTLDTFRVRSNNCLSLLIELRDVIDSWAKGNVKRCQTVEACVDETKSALEKKIEGKNICCLNFSLCPLQTLLEQLDKYKKIVQEEDKKDFRDTTEASHAIFYLTKIINENENKYLANLLDQIDYILFNRKKEEYKFALLIELDYYITEFSCELIRIGYSKMDLYMYFLNILKGQKDLTTEFYEIRKKFLSKEKSIYTTIFKIGVGKKIDGSVYDEFKKKVPDEYMRCIKDFNIIKHLKEGAHFGYFINREETLDGNGAVKESRRKLSNILDSIHKGDKALNVQPYGIVFKEQPEIVCLGKFFVYNLDNSITSKHVVSENLYSYMLKIKESKYIDSNIYKRIESALRHLRIGDYQDEIEQKFINYWIALEFLFSSPSSKQSTFFRLMECFVTISKCCYVKRNLEYLKAKLVYHNVVEESETIDWQNTDYMDSLIKKIPMSLICLRYQIQMMKSHCHSKSKLKDYVQNHGKNVKYHLQRIYRLRNELIHEAALKQNIENITSNLRYYLIFVINQCMSYFLKKDESKEHTSIDDFYWEYETLCKLILYNKFELKTLCDVSVESYLVL